ncbi:hypothetical protein N0V93_003313 [Gnomoniopsis smithogilvyi]|uniref:Uncharacterized protein n=1 Tax=Gnomoniopsis smithogilvyi TaxID=1191159 RepID=A0A9W8YYF2_9PEZI|nr:hypothetical protein N0V93_003313 [Gnomoniopsis smithogilvyi]
MGTFKKALGVYMTWCYVINLVASAPPSPPVIDPPSGDSSPDETTDSHPLLDISTSVEGNSTIDLDGWRPILNANYTPSLAGLPNATRFQSEEDAKALRPVADGDFSVAVVPIIMQYLGSIGGILGIFQFFESWGERIGRLIRNALHKEPHNGRQASWAVGIQVGLSTGGLKGSGGNFPQVCLYDGGAQLLGYTDTAIKIQHSKFWKLKGGQHHWKFDSPRPEGMPFIQDGGLSAVGVWPIPGRERDLGTQQAPYLLLIKRHYDAICISGVYVHWPDSSTWILPGTVLGECFWMDHRGTLDHHQDKEEEYIHKDFNRIGVPGSGVKKDNFPAWLWASDVEQEEGIPTGDLLTEGMKATGVDHGRVAQYVKIFLPAFRVNSYESLENVTTAQIAGNPAKLSWGNGDIMAKRGVDNLVLPYLHPNDEWRDPKARLVNSFPPSLHGSEQAPPECLPDWYRDEHENVVNPADGKRCQYKGKALPWHECRKHHHRRGPGDPEDPPKSIKQHFSRSLVIEKLPRRDVNGVTTNCFDDEAEVLVEANAPRLKREAQWESIEHWTGEGKWKRNLDGDGALVQTQSYAPEDLD